MLDPNDTRPPYLQVANALRAAILTRKYLPGNRLPSSHDLAKQYGVARMTIQNALRLLNQEGLIMSRPGSGMYVRDRAEEVVGLRPHVEGAFNHAHVSIDFAGFSGETLHGAMQEPLDKIRIGRLTPETITVRVLVPDTSRPWTLPCRADNLEDDPAFRDRAHGISNRHTSALADSIEELARFGLIQEGRLDIRVHRSAPLFKLYILNNEEIFFGFYPIKEQTISINNEEHPVFDLMGKDAILFHQAATADEKSIGSQYVRQARTWFESMWDTVARPMR